MTFVTYVLFYTSIAEQYFAVNICPQYENNEDTSFEGGAV